MKQTAILLIAHGSPVPAANAELLDVAAGIRAESGGDIVEAAYLEGAAPGIPEGIETCVAQGAARVLLIPYFLLPGRHAAQDLPAAAEAARKRHPDVEFVLGEPLGFHEALGQIVIQRIRETGVMWYDGEG